MKLFKRILEILHCSSSIVGLKKSLKIIKTSSKITLIIVIKKLFNKIRVRFIYVYNIKFCEGIQAAAPVDSYVVPEPWAMPGYDSDVIMAAGAFVSGSSIEISADGPLKPPYTAYFQGGLTFETGKLAVMLAASNVLNIKE